MSNYINKNCLSNIPLTDSDSLIFDVVIKQLEALIMNKFDNYLYLGIIGNNSNHVHSIFISGKGNQNVLRMRKLVIFFY